MTDTRKWSAAAVVLIALIFAASWFLLVSPKRGEAADLRDQKVSQDEANQRLQQQLQVLQAQQQDLPKERARLAELQTRIPDNPALPSLIRDLTAAGRKVGVSLDTLAPSVPAPVVAAPTAPATGESTAAADGVSAASASTLFQVPLAMTVSGSYFELEQFLNKLEGLKRSLLVTGFDLGESTAEEPAPGDLTIELTGRVFISQVGAPTQTTTPSAASAATAAQ